ncbi:hypothetical protein EG68_01838 [Paragonimus skrjabini miyazakii]|uniref:Uncharacterized protein n=1 Tax=Paragonimus skrjabini miyazakii TaxID=59628 RepID=A0A8S9Z6S4_9TREM|nr:hypothetical protein EG68_01838 [Paragonimus skrjabini miyazakii]
MPNGPIFPSYGYYAVFLFAACTFLLSSQYANTSQIRSSWVEKTLIKDLLHDYEKRARPVVDGVSPEVSIGNYSVQQIKVEYGMALMQILQLDENEQILTVSVRSLYRWSDHHLVWNPEDYDNITHITIPTSKIWIPDVALYNYADERLEERRDCAAKVSHNGVVEWHPMAIYKSTCAVKIKYFPYDKQNCTLKFGPWTYDAGRVNGTLYDVDWNLKEYKESPEWKLLKHRAWTKTEKYDCCAEIYADLMFELIIERQPAYYNYLLILPCFLLSSLTLVVFWLPPENPAKMVLGMNIFVAFFLLLLLLKSSIPSASSSFPLIGNYYCANMTLVTLSTFLCLIVVNLHYRGDRRNEVPPWLRKLAIQHGARLLFVNVAPPGGPKSKSPEKKGNKSAQPVQPNEVTSQPPYGSAFGFYPGVPRLPYSETYDCKLY